MRNQNNPQISTGGLTAEQKARISHNFRAAKALLARKRPRNDAASPDHLLPSRVKDGNRGETPSGFSSIKRVALKEIPVNEPSPFSGYKSKMEYEQQSGGFCSGSLAANRNVGVFVEKEFGLDSFRTPLKQTCSKSSESFSIPSILDVDDDLDESILEEIDALCEQKSTRKVEKTPPSCISFVGNGNAFCEQKSVVKIEKSPPTCISFVGNGIALCEPKSAVKIEKTPPSCISFVENGNALCEQKSVVKIEKTPPNCNSFVGYGNALCELKSAVKAEKPSPSSNSLEGVVEESILEEIDALYEQKSVVKAEKSSPSSNSLVENVEESILEEIDALCEQKSAVKAEKPSLISNSLVGNCGNLNTSLKPSFDCEGVESKGTLDLGKDVEIKEGLVNSQSVKIGSMPEEFSKYMLSLNDRQREAACTDISTPLMIVAGPGSGKTSTMVGRVLMLLHEGISPSNILAMTFTTAAASEMRDRIGTVAGKAIAKELTISTFHSFSLQLCRLHAEKLGRTTEFLIYGHGQQRRAVIEAVRLVENEKSNKNLDSHTCGGEPNGITSPEYYKDTAKKWLKFVTRAKASGKTPEECSKMGDEMGAAIIGHYNDILKACNALDYHDLISCSVKLLNEYPEVRKECQDSWRAIVIDEFQDTSAMQYSFLQILASHNRITIVGDDDQSIFGFNGADVSGFDSFRKDFSNHKEIRLNKNYRSTRYIVEAASSVIKNNKKRCQLKNVDTDNSSGSKIIIKECHNEDAQCAFVIDKIFETAAIGSATKGLYGNIAILYRRQVSGKVFQVAFRERKIPFNIHGVAFYRKKVVRAILAMLRTTLPGCDDGSYRRVFKAFLPFDKEEKKRVIEHIDKISTVRKCSFVSAACDIFSAKISGTFKRSQITQGRKVLSTLEMISKLVHREQSISAVITSVANMVPEKYLLEQRAVVDVDGGKLLNEDNDIRSVLQYLLDDVSNFISTKFVNEEGENEILGEKGCLSVLKAFINHISDRERENFRFRKEENKNSVTLTTIHQSKGLEWDMVFIVKANESEIPLLHEFNGVAKENGSSLEEERRLFYVAMTRARRKLFILYVSMDSNYQIVQPSRFLKEIPEHLREVQGDLTTHVQAKHHDCLKDTGQVPIDLQRSMQSSKTDTAPNDMPCNNLKEGQLECMEYMEAGNGNSFIKRFSVDERSIVSHIFHQWAKKKAFQDPKRLLDKVGFVIDERLRVKNNKHKVDVLRMLKSCLKCDEAFQFAEYVLRWETIPAEKRAHLTREKQEHFQKLRIEKSMGSSEPTAKQKSYLQNLGCTVVPTSRLHASHLIEQYKSL